MRKFRRKPGKHRHLLTVLLICISFLCHYRHFCSWECYCAISIIPRTVSKLPLCLISLSLNRLLNKLVKYSCGERKPRTFSCQGSKCENQFSCRIYFAGSGSNYSSIICPQFLQSVRSFSSQVILFTPIILAITFLWLSERKFNTRSYNYCLPSLNFSWADFRNLHNFMLSEKQNIVLPV